ncbi:MAG TPA: hypothetical protein VL137_14520 [Polyangiaceae bacterium]|jgi:hypothetical protein|nr:hypothetical protein [Polyangiaceae bacterium]
MRLGLIGPVGSQAQQLRSVCEFLLDRCRVERAIYLGLDDQLDRTTEAWGREILGGEASEEALWIKAGERCCSDEREHTGNFVEQTRRFRALRAFHCMPGEFTRSVEILGGHLAILIHDKAALNEEDILPARYLIYGKGSAPLIKQVGQRWFLCPGSLDSAGVIVLDDTGAAGIDLKLYDGQCALVRSERLSTLSAAKLTVSGG